VFNCFPKAAWELQKAPMQDKSYKRFSKACGEEKQTFRTFTEVICILHVALEQLLPTAARGLKGNR
jgi:hypothetical protein